MQPALAWIHSSGRSRNLRMLLRSYGTRQRPADPTAGSGDQDPHRGQFPIGVVSSVSFVSTTNTARSFAGFVLLAFALTL